jgi:hypothetical protein
MDPARLLTSWAPLVQTGVEAPTTRDCRLPILYGRTGETDYG